MPIRKASTRRTLLRCLMPRNPLTRTCHACDGACASRALELRGEKREGGWVRRKGNCECQQCISLCDCPRLHVHISSHPHSTPYLTLSSLHLRARVCLCARVYPVQSYNWMLSSLALLISNVFLYQSKNSIDSRFQCHSTSRVSLECVCARQCTHPVSLNPRALYNSSLTHACARTRSATDRLSTILAVAEQMIGCQPGGGSSSSSSSSKPAFLWVLRDMQLQMKQEPKAEMTEKLEDAQLRKLKRSFREYDCFPLPRPVHTYVCMYVYMHVCVHVYGCVRVCFARAHTHTHTHTHAHAHTGGQ